MFQTNAKAETEGVWFKDDEEGVAMLICHRDNPKAKKLAQRYTAPYIQSFRKNSPQVFAVSEKIEAQVIAEAVWIGTKTRKKDGDDFEKWADGVIPDAEGKPVACGTVDARVALLKDENWRPMRELIESLMRDDTRYAPDASKAGMIAGE